MIPLSIRAGSALCIFSFFLLFFFFKKNLRQVALSFTEILSETMHIPPAVLCFKVLNMSRGVTFPFRRVLCWAPSIEIMTQSIIYFECFMKLFAVLLILLYLL